MNIISDVPVEELREDVIFRALAQADTEEIYDELYRRNRTASEYERYIHYREAKASRPDVEVAEDLK